MADRKAILRAIFGNLRRKGLIAGAVGGVAAGAYGLSKYRQNKQKQALHRNIEDIKLKLKHKAFDVDFAKSPKVKVGIFGDKKSQKRVDYHMKLLSEHYDSIKNQDPYKRAAIRASMEKEIETRVQDELVTRRQKDRERYQLHRRLVGLGQVGDPNFISEPDEGVGSEVHWGAPLDRVANLYLERSREPRDPSAYITGDMKVRRTPVGLYKESQLKVRRIKQIKNKEWRQARREAARRDEHNIENISDRLWGTSDDAGD